MLNPDGSLADFQPVVSEVVKGRSLPQSLLVPGQSKPPGAGINPCFLWDNAVYMLGQVPQGRDPQWALKRFEAFRDRLVPLEKEIDEEAFSAVCRFLQAWSQERLGDFPSLPEITTSFGAFRLQGEQEYVHNLPGVRAWWQRQVAGVGEASLEGFCLVTGDKLPLARLHEPKIKGVMGTQSGGATLISSNLDAFDSYGKEQGYNAPTSQQAAFQYTTALNRLLADQARPVQIGDATTVFWTETPCPAEQIIPSIFAGLSVGDDTEDTAIVRRVRSFLDCLRQGKPDGLAGELGKPDTPYYILGLSPNAARISVRFWLTGSLGNLAHNLREHVRALDVIGLDDRPPVMRDLLRQTAPAKSGWPDDEKIPNSISGELTRAVLTGQRYPAAFFAAILRRVRAEGFVTKYDEHNHRGHKDFKRAMAVRAAAIKAYLIRNYRKEITVSLDPNRPEPAYHLGRWFALLEKVQQEAHDNALNSTIKDRFYTSASATPAAVFPRLIQLSQHHLRKQENMGLRVTREKQVQQVADRLSMFPRQLNLENQGLFHLGYYHQVQDLYTSKKNGSTESQTNINQQESE
jgi:CRISPR-associated protein Csd1